MWKLTKHNFKVLRNIPIRSFCNPKTDLKVLEVDNVDKLSKEAKRELMIPKEDNNTAVGQAIDQGPDLSKRPKGT